MQGPPRDLASLVEPKAALEQLAVATDEDTLIELLTKEGATMAGAAEALDQIGGAAQRGDVDYVKKLLAVRLLEKMKSQKAMPALKKLAAGEDITLSDAAKTAVALVEGKPDRRPSGQAALKAICDKLPAEIEFLALLDCERGAKAQTVAEIMTAFMKSLDNPEAAPLKQMLGGTQPQAMLDQMLPQARMGIIRTLARTGNIRVDGVAMAMPGNIHEEDQDTFYVAWVIKGLWDPQRLGSICEGSRGFDENRPVAGHSLYVDNRDGGICVLDEHTIVLAAFPGQGLGVETLIHALAAENKSELPDVPAQALEIIKKDDRRIAVATSQLLSPELLAEGRRVMADHIQRIENRPDLAGRPERQLEVAGMRTVLAALDMEQAVGHVTVKGEVVLRGTSKDEAAAAALDMALKAVDEKFRAMLQTEMAGAPEPIRKLLEATMNKALWTTEADGRTVALRSNFFLPAGILPAIMGMRFATHRAAAAPPAPIEARPRLEKAPRREKPTQPDAPPDTR
jgi:hypothetical protein